MKHPTVEILCAMDAARSHIYHAATVVGEGTLDDEAEIACRMAKAQATDALCYAGDRAVQFHGGIGYTWECYVQLYFKRQKQSQMLWGDAAWHRGRLADIVLGKVS